MGCAGAPKQERNHEAKGHAVEMGLPLHEVTGGRANAGTIGQGQANVVG